MFGDNAAAASGPDERFMNGAAKFFLGSGGIGTLTLTNIPFASYSLVVYSLGARNQFPVGFTLGATSYYTNVSGISPTGPGYIDNNPATPFTYTQITSTNANAPTANGDYAVFTGLTGTSQNLDIVVNQQEESRRGGISGFQIINTTPAAAPEPSQFAAFAVGLLGLGALAMKARRRRAVA